MGKKEVQKDIRYEGYFLIDSGLKIEFDISAEEGGEHFELLYGNSEFTWKKGDAIWLGEENDYLILADRIIGFSISETS